MNLVPANRRAVVQDVADTMKDKGITDLSSPEGIVLLETLIGALEEAGATTEISESESEGSYLSETDDDESLFSEMEEDSEAEVLKRCLNCDDPLNNDKAFVLPSCKHVFCEECLDPSSAQICPECREPYSIEDLAMEPSVTTPMKVTPNKRIDCAPIVAEHDLVMDMDDEEVGISPKVQALLDEIGKMQDDEKGVIFSQWTSFLDIIQAEMRAAGHTYTRIDGSMNAQQRLRAMEKFNTERCDTMKTPRFVLCSLKACGTGINLIRGNIAFVMDPWWNYSVEQQAYDRVHRLGQKRDVRVIRFVMKDSIEERMVSLQTAKAALGKGSLEKISAPERSKARLTFLRDLFEIGEAEVKWDTDFTEFIVDDDDSNDDVDWLVEDGHHDES
jgi:SWI/SNF-related matrix-associated actin-dependent regulator of chromatin subfamily A3